MLPRIILHQTTIWYKEECTDSFELWDWLRTIILVIVFSSKYLLMSVKTQNYISMKWYFSPLEKVYTSVSIWWSYTHSIVHASVHVYKKLILSPLLTNISIWIDWGKMESLSVRSLPKFFHYTAVAQKFLEVSNVWKGVPKSIFTLTACSLIIIYIFYIAICSSNSLIKSCWIV